MLGKYSDILSAGNSEWAYLSGSTSPNSSEITKLVTTLLMSMYLICYDQQNSEKAEEFKNKSERRKI